MRDVKNWNQGFTVLSSHTSGGDKEGHLLQDLLGRPLVLIGSLQGRNSFFHHDT